MNAPYDAEILQRTQLTKDIFTLDFKFTDPEVERNYQFTPGQFNMVYLFGVGEVAISIVSDPEQEKRYSHTIRQVGRITRGLAQLQPGDHIGIRGPFGRGWPLNEAENKDVLVITGGLGCAPSVSIIEYIIKRRENYKKLTVLQGVKHSADLIYREHYQRWSKLPDTEVLLAADKSAPGWAWHTGLITELLNDISIDPNDTLCLMCGPEAMMLAAINYLTQQQLPEQAIHFSMERNMECAIGHCGHCQLGGKFVCKDGPIFCYPDVKDLLGKQGF